MRKIDYYIKQFNQDNDYKKVVGIWKSKRKIQKRKKQLRKISKKNSFTFEMLNSYKLDIDEKINNLKQLANKGFGKINTKEYKKLRAKKNYLTGEVCYICGEKAYCMHHIVPLCHGGNNDDRNLIPICLDCHNKIHPFMYRSKK